MHSSSSITSFPLLHLPPETRLEVHARLGIRDIANLRLACRQARDEVEPIVKLFKLDRGLISFIFRPPLEKTAEVVDALLSGVSLSLPEPVVASRVSGIAELLSGLPPLKAREGLRSFLLQSRRFPPTLRLEWNSRAMSATLRAHQKGGDPALPLEVFTPLNPQEESLALQCLLNWSVEQWETAETVPAAWNQAMELHLRALDWACREPDTCVREKALVALAAIVASFVRFSGPLEGVNKDSARPFLAALTALIGRQSCITQANLLNSAFRLAEILPGSLTKLLELVTALLSGKDEDLAPAWRTICELADERTQDFRDLHTALLRRALAFEDANQRQGAVDQLARVAYEGHNEMLATDCMHALCELVPATAGQISELVRRLDSPKIRQLRESIPSGSFYGMADLMQEYAQVDVTQLLMREILPRIQALSTPEERMSCAPEVSMFALGDFDAHDEIGGFRRFYSGFLSAIFTDHAQWTPEQRDSGRMLLQTLAEQAANPPRPHALYRGRFSPIALEQLRQFRPE